MKKQLISISCLSALMLLFSILCHIVGYIFVDNYHSYYFSHFRLEEVIAIIIFSLFLSIATNYYKKGGIIIFSIVNILFGFFIIRNDIDGAGWDFLSTFVFLVSQCNHLVSVLTIGSETLQKINITIFFGVHITFIGYLDIAIRKKICYSNNGYMSSKE